MLNTRSVRRRLADHMPTASSIGAAGKVVNACTVAPPPPPRRPPVTSRRPRASDATEAVDGAHLRGARRGRRSEMGDASPARRNLLNGTIHLLDRRQIVVGRCRHVCCRHGADLLGSGHLVDRRGGLLRRTRGRPGVAHNQSIERDSVSFTALVSSSVSRLIFAWRLTIPA